ncbi:MAG: ROK family protein [Eubacteriales bacterium]|nr:ROK family protein [Eubacteriales bacterium]
MKFINISCTPKILPELDKDFRPAEVMNRIFREKVLESGNGVDLSIIIERNDGFVSRYDTSVFPDWHELSSNNLPYVERLVKTLLWTKGGYKIYICGSEKIGNYIKDVYSLSGERGFDVKFMSRVYEKPFEVIVTDLTAVPSEKEDSRSIGRHLDGCRIGFDAGGSDRKVSAVVNREVVFSEEVVWFPKLQENPDYHYREIVQAFKSAASKMPRVDAIGVSAAGVYINNRTLVASLFIKVPDDLFNAKVKDIFINAAKELGNVPISVVNDGDVAALAGSMALNKNKVLGIAMGTSEAAGYVSDSGSITGWLNELAFVPVDFNPGAMEDEWSGDIGCGCKYFSQDSVIKLAPAAGIELDSSLSPAEKLKVVQRLLTDGHEGARKIYESIGTYFGYSVAYYAEFYDIDYVQLLGRVASGEGGDIILNNAGKVFEEEYPGLASKINLYIPDEYERRVGQSIAAASLCEVK